MSEDDYAIYCKSLLHSVQISDLHYFKPLSEMESHQKQSLQSFILSSPLKRSIELKDQKNSKRQKTEK